MLIFEGANMNYLNVIFSNNFALLITTNSSDNPLLDAAIMTLKNIKSEDEIKSTYSKIKISNYSSLSFERLLNELKLNQYGVDI